MGEAERDSLQSLKQHIVVVSAMKLWLFAHGPLSRSFRAAAGARPFID
jgi:hypothetical protein